MRIDVSILFSTIPESQNAGEGPAVLVFSNNDNLHPHSRYRPHLSLHANPPAKKGSPKNPTRGNLPAKPPLPKPHTGNLPYFPNRATKNRGNLPAKDHFPPHPVSLLTKSRHPESHVSRQTPRCDHPLLRPLVPVP